MPDIECPLVISVRVAPCSTTETTSSAPVNYDLAQYPEARRLLDSSLCLFSHTYPISPQPLSVVEQYVAAFSRVWSRLDEVVAAAGAGASS